LIIFLEENGGNSGNKPMISLEEIEEILDINGRSREKKEHNYDNGHLCPECSTIRVQSGKLLSLFQTEMLKIIGKESNRYKGKILCNCPCNGPYCIDLIHPCSKPHLHYPQREKAIVDIRNNLRKELREKV